jgi:alkanesulfonate monooxygenase SsuD/methylene tetrahydromethanopterin reductase-like flavin-dependent oxidoreductase (luciferase family)
MEAAVAPRVGVIPPIGAGPDVRALVDALERMSTAGLDHVVVGDHVSFFGGFGIDGLIYATALAMLHPSLPVHTNVYLLPLRHPVLVARQISTFASLAPGRLVLGVGVGGEDRHEVEVCGVDPKTRGRRMDECLVVLRALLQGQPVTHRGTFFDIDEAAIVPAPAEPVPIVVGGRSAAAVHRAGSLGDGWLGIWVSAERFEAAAIDAAEAAAASGRDPGLLRHAMTVWCGFGPDPAAGRALVAPVMEALYGLPFARFERYVPTGTASDVADALLPYVAAGCTSFSLLARGAHAESVIDAAAEVRTLLRARAP